MQHLLTQKWWKPLGAPVMWQVRVLTESVARGMTVMDRGLKRWNNPHAWTERPLVQVSPLALFCCPSGLPAHFRSPAALHTNLCSRVFLLGVQVALAVNAVEVISMLLERMAA